MRELTKLIKDDMKPALGVTEPGAIAFAVAKAREQLVAGAEEISKVRVYLNSGMYKNAFTCGIPNSDHYGNVYAAALGAVAADSSLGLESLSGITKRDNELAKKMVAEKKVEVVMDHIGSEITIRAEVYTEQENCTVWINGSHTNITKIEKTEFAFTTGKKIIPQKKNKEKFR
jgi:L-cysteine desulfidase